MSWINDLSAIANILDPFIVTADEQQAFELEKIKRQTGLTEAEKGMPVTVYPKEEIKPVWDLEGKIIFGVGAAVAILVLVLFLLFFLKR